MYTKLSDAVLAKGTTDAYSPFIVETGDVKLGAVLLVKQFNDTLILVFEKDALRTIKSLADMTTFTSLVADLKASGKAVNYPDNVAAFMNPEARFKEYLETGATFGMNVSPKLPEVYRTTKDQFTTAFTPPTPPTPPRVFAPEFAIPVAAQAWFDNQSTRAIEAPVGVYAQDALRIGYKDGVVTRLLNGSGYTITIKQAEGLWNRWLKGKWANTPINSTRLVSGWETANIQGHSVSVYGDRVTIGCQTISRAAIERVARILNWEM